jgi:hypothetical protein
VGYDRLSERDPLREASEMSPVLRYLLLALLAEEASAEFMYQRSHGAPGSSCMPLAEFLEFREAGGQELWERWIWRKAEANSEALRAAGLLT